MKNFREDLADKLSADRINAMAAVGFVCCFVLEMSVFTTLFSAFVDNIQIANSTYLNDLPLIGAIFPDTSETSASHLISALMALFCVATPIWLWSWIISEKIMDNPQLWISYPQNQIYAGLAAVLIVLVIGLECLNLYELISKQAAQPEGFVKTAEEASIQKWLAENKGMAVAASLILTLVNFVLALISVKAFHALKSEE